MKTHSHLCMIHVDEGVMPVKDIEWINRNCLEEM